MAEGCPCTEYCAVEGAISLPVGATSKMDKLEEPLLVATTQLKVLVLFATLDVIPAEKTEAPPELVAKGVRTPVAGLY